MDGPVLWPARNVAEYAYCPRLFYLMEVEGIFLGNRDTEEGRFVHRRVDRPSNALESPEKGSEPDPDKPRSVRSLVLSSPRLGLTATLDLAEIQGNRATPVEFRKGHPSHRNQSPANEPAAVGNDEAAPLPEPWPLDRVQVGLQALLLEEAGYQVDQAVVYYAAEKRRLSLAVNEALKQEAFATLQAARQCAEGPRPLPLQNDPKCLRCSLQPVCLPDEIHHQRRSMEDPEWTPRRIWPLRDDGIHVVAQQEGVRLGIQGMTLQVTDREGKVVRSFPLANVESLSVLGNVQVTTQALHALSEEGVPVAFLSSAGRLIAMVDPMDSVSAEVRRAQVRILDRPEKCLELARSLISAKITNQRTLLMRNHPGLPEEAVRELAIQSEAAAQADSLDSVRGHEGQAAAIYFRHFPDLLKGEMGESFARHGRQRRPPPDPVNSCLSMGYTMLVHECVAALRTARLEPSIGGFHVSRPGRPALALDLMEPFRPLIADSIALSTFNRGELTSGHFLNTAAGCHFTASGRKAFFLAYGRRMATEVTHPVFEYRLSYRRMIHLHARMIAAWMLGEIPGLSFLTTR